jgi:hypothetical protein
MSLDVTVGGETAESYVDVDYADAYFFKRLHSGLWVNDAPKENALSTATQLLDRYMQWVGYKYTANQALEWPRSNALNDRGFYYSVSEIPERVKKATCELAVLLIEEDRTAEDDLKGFASLSLGSLKIVTDKADRKNPIPKTIAAMLRILGAPFGQSAFVELNRG